MSLCIRPHSVRAACSLYREPGQTETSCALQDPLHFCYRPASRASEEYLPRVCSDFHYWSTCSFRLAASRGGEPPERCCVQIGPCIRGSDFQVAPPPLDYSQVSFSRTVDIIDTDFGSSSYPSPQKRRQRKIIGTLLVSKCSSVWRVPSCPHFLHKNSPLFESINLFEDGLKTDFKYGPQGVCFRGGQKCPTNPKPEEKTLTSCGRKLKL
jgi:hypothetical protein